MSKQGISLLLLMLASGHLPATDEFVPLPQHLNVFIQNPKQAPYLLKDKATALILTPMQQRDFIHFVAVRLGIPDTTPRLLMPTPASFPTPDSIEATQNTDNSNSIIKTHWKNNVLFISIQPNQQDYDTLLQNALTALEQSNHGQLPVINGRDLKAALEKRDGVAFPIYKRTLATKKTPAP